MTKYKASLKDQQVSLKDALIDPYYYRHDKDKITFTDVVILSVGIAIGICLLSALRRCELEPQPAKVQHDCQQCHSRMVAMVKYFEKAGSRSPEEMANAVLSTKSPRLLAAIAKVETRGNSHIRNSGYRRKHDGAYQVNSKYWGRVPTDALGQALQAEKILSELTEEMPIKKALSVYGGDSTDKYQKRVLAELTRVP